MFPFCSESSHADPPKASFHRTSGDQETGRKVIRFLYVYNLELDLNSLKISLELQPRNNGLKDWKPARKLIKPNRKWSRESDSNRRPTHYECVALPTELSRQTLSSSALWRIPKYLANFKFPHPASRRRQFKGA